MLVVLASANVVRIHPDHASTLPQHQIS